jgi:protein TonB
VTYGFDMPPEERIAVLASRRDLALDDSARRNYPILADQRMLDQLSPDRNCGVFDGAAAGWKGDPHGIWVTKLSSPRSEGTSLQLLAQGLYPSWSHKGDKIAYVYGDDGPFRSGEPGASASLGVLQLRALYWAESPPGRLGRIYYPTWSPTDKYISFRYDGGLKLGVIRLDGLHSGEPCCSTSACIIDVKQGDRVRAKGWQRWRQRIPAWIDEHRLIYDARTDGDWDLYVLDVSTGSETNITNNDQNDFLLRPAWLEGNFLADGKLLSDLDRHGGTLVETHEVRDASPEVRMPTADATRRLPQSCPARAAELRKLTGLDSVGTIHLYAPDKRQIPESGPRGEVEKHRAGAAPPIVPYYKADVKPDPVLIPVAEYPSSARAAGIRGHAVVEALVDADGTVADTRVLKSSGSAILDQAAMDAARRAKFSPAQFQGEPARVWVSIPYMFKP